MPLQSFPLILNHSDPIAALEHLSQNFPLYSSAFANKDLKADTKSGLSPVNEGRYRELWHNRQIWSSLRSGRGVTWQGMRGDGREGRVWIGAKEVAETEMGLFQCVVGPSCCRRLVDADLAVPSAQRPAPPAGRPQPDVDPRRPGQHSGRGAGRHQGPSAQQPPGPLRRLFVGGQVRGSSPPSLVRCAALASAC